MILLTGVSGGIGSELATYLVETDQVIGFFNHNKPQSQPPKSLTYHKLDLKSAEDIQTFIDKHNDKLSHITLVHCAAIKIDGLSANYKIDDWDQMMDINLKGNFILTQALLPCMLRERWGRIIHISSQGAIQGSPGTLAYSTCKTGLIGFSRVLAKEYARFNITSNVLSLGHFETGLYNQLAEDVKERLLNQIPARKLGKVSNVANAIQFLMQSEFVNGATINIDGGM
jgi:3-oxoacyl-[acyl-carrier protein] reductase